MYIKEWITERLILKPTQEEDHDELAPMLLDDNVTKYLYEHLTKIPSIEFAKSFLSSVLSSYAITFTIRIKDTNEAIGQIGYGGTPGVLDVFYWLGSKYQKKGYASEAAVELSYEIFKKSNFNVFSISFYANNMPSRKLAYKIGENLLNKNPEWIVIDKEDKITECEIVDLSDKYVTIKMNVVGDMMCSSYLCCYKSAFPDEYLSVGTKYTEKLRFFDIAKNENQN